MALYEDVTADLKRDEGFRPCAYQDSEGYWTIGYGTLIDDRIDGAGISKDEADDLLMNRLCDLADELSRAKPYFRALPPAVQRALLNMAYNMGVPNLLGFKKMWAAIERRDWHMAAVEALDSKWARQVGDRSKRVAALIRKG